MKNSSAPLSADDSRAIIRLLGEICAHPGANVAKNRHLMEGLCRIINADRWSCALAAQMDSAKPAVHICLHHGGFSEETYAAFILAYTDPNMGGAHALFSLESRENRCHLTRFGEQKAHRNGQKQRDDSSLWESAEIKGILTFVRALDHRIFSSIGIYRRPSVGEFTSREKQIAHILLSKVPILHVEKTSKECLVTFSTLTHRQRTITALLIQGYVRNRIASYLGISPHTLSDHIKSIFQRFGVHSKAGLIVRFQGGAC